MKLSLTDTQRRASAVKVLSYSDSDLLIIMRQVSSLKADQLELTSACLSSLKLMKPLRSVSTVWNHWYASGLTPGGMLPAETDGEYFEESWITVKKQIGPVIMIMIKLFLMF